MTFPEADQPRTATPPRGAGPRSAPAPRSEPATAGLPAFARHLRATGWTRLPATFADLLATRLWPDDSVDTVAVFDLAHAHAIRESPDGTVVWLFDGDLDSVRRAVDGLGPPGRAARTPPPAWRN